MRFSAFYAILSLFLICRPLQVDAQCAGGIHWINGPNAGGTLRDTLSALVYDTIFVSTSLPTSGTIAAGRPTYWGGTSVWNGYNFQTADLARGGGRGSSTTYDFQSALDSFQIHFRLMDLRGDFLNWEDQRIRGFRNGTPVTCTYKDAVNGCTGSGTDVAGGSANTAAAQGAIRIFFNGPVDSVIITSIAANDYVIFEILARCDIVLAESQKLEAWTENKQNKLRWTGKSGTEYSIERSGNGRDWHALGVAQAVSGQNLLFTDASRLPGSNYYRVFSGTYSNTVHLKSARNAVGLHIYPNPAVSYIDFTSKINIVKIAVYDLMGRNTGLFSGQFRAGATHRIYTGQLMPGIYQMRFFDINGNIQTETIVVGRPG
ncbi:MAG: T9SS type A sorting domain-containing protein [Gemmatimonadaceae bacterium]|nr:T9SS type A sorting domain-containing protein [Chitinophagaceae bacterium]